MPFPKGYKEGFLSERKRTRIAEDIEFIIEKMGEALGLQKIANPRRRCRFPEELLKGVGLEHGVGITGTVA
jgi:hypothetical protein